ncbi:MAG: LysR substrate-binding domain-containing protein [Duganella sp.]
MNKPLRSLSGLLDFDCAARWGSFKLAAQELHKTPAAISLQVKQLEEALGFELFIRHPRHITLTEKGQELAATVRRLLGELRTKVAALQGGDEEKILRISTTHSLAIKWLVQRIDRFTKLYPELDIRIDSTDRLVDLTDDNTDVVLRISTVVNDDPDLLFHVRLVAVYSPSLLAPGAAELTAADLTRFPLLYEDSTDNWISMLRDHDLLKGKYDFSRSYTNAAVLVQAALAGHGVGLTHYTIAYEDIRSGALKMIPGFTAKYGRGYRLLVNPAKRGLSKIRHFSAWLGAEIAEMERSFD